jgi:hypothetical protein
MDKTITIETVKGQTTLTYGTPKGRLAPGVTVKTANGEQIMSTVDAWFSYSGYPEVRSWLNSLNL